MKRTGSKLYREDGRYTVILIEEALPIDTLIVATEEEADAIITKWQNGEWQLLNG